MYTNTDAQNLLEIIKTQSTLLDTIIESQKKIREAIIAKSWAQLETDLPVLDGLSQKFAALAAQQKTLCGPDQGVKADFYRIVANFPQEYRPQLFDAFTTLRHKLFISKIENKGMDDYLRTTRDFLQGVFDSVVPTRKNKVYSNTGALVNTAPESLVLNTLM
jgi:hypothetical protein